jgi:mannosyltransferase
MSSKTERAWAAAPLASVAALTVAAFALRLVRIEQGLWFDEIVTLVRSVREPVASIVTHFPGTNDHPLYTLLAHFTVALFGEHAWSLRLPAAIFGALTIPAVYLLGTVLTTRRESLLACALLTVSYQHIWFSQDARGYTLLAFITCVATALFLIGLRHRSRAAFLAYGVVIAVGVYTHLTMVFLMAGHAVVALALIAGERRSSPSIGVPIRFIVESMAIATVVSIALYAPFAGHVAPIVDRSSGLAAHGVSTSAMLQQALLQLSAGFGVAGLVSASLLCVAGAVSYLRRAPIAAALLAAPAVLLALAVAVLHQPMRPRFFFFLIGPAALVVIRGTSVVGRRIANALERPRAEAIIGGSLAFALVAISASYLPGVYGPKQDFVSAQAFVERQRAQGDAVATAGLAIYPYESYFRTDWVPVRTSDELGALRRREPRLWIIYSFPEYIADERLRDTIAATCRPAAVFNGTVGGGGVTVCSAAPRQIAMGPP